MGKTGRRWVRLLVAVVCVAGLTWTLASLGPARVLGVALRADPWWLALSVIPLIGRFLIWGYKWQRMLGRHARLSYFRGMRVLAAGSFVNLATPTAKLAGGVVRASLLRRIRGWPLAECYGWTMADQVTNVLGNVLLFGLLAVAVANYVPLEAGRRLFLATGLLCLGGLLVGSALRGPAWRFLARPGVGTRLAGLVPARFRRDRGEDSPTATIRLVFEPLLQRGGYLTFLSDVALASAAFASLCVANGIVMRALGVDAPLLLISTAVVLGYFAGVAVGVWGGVGVTEAALTALFIQFGIPAGEAAAGALLHRGVYYLFVLTWGGYGLLREGGGADHSATSNSTPV